MLNRYCLVVCFLWLLPCWVCAQNQTVVNGQATDKVTFPGPGCNYSWTNDNPFIGLPAAGNGDIASFKAVNNSAAPITATIKAKPNLPQTGLAFVTSARTNAVTIIDVATKNIVGQVNVGQWPTIVSTSALYQTAYISNQDDNTITVIDAKDFTKQTTIPVGTKPLGSAMSPDGKQIYVANARSNNVSIIDVATKKVIKTVAVGTYPISVVFSPTGSLVYVSNDLSSSISVIDAATENVIKTVSVAPIYPSSMVITADGKTLVVTDQNGVYTIETTNLTVTGRVPTTLPAIGVVLSKDGSKIYATGNAIGNSVVYVISTADFSVKEIVIGPALEGLSLTPDGSEVYVSNEGGQEVTVINTATDQVSAHIPLTANGASGGGNFILPADACDGGPIYFTIKVNPSPIVSVGPVSGNIIACQGTASTSPFLQQFSISGSKLYNDISLLAPVGFEVSVNQNSGYAGSITIPPVANAVNATVYVRSLAGAPAGNISGDVAIAAPGIPDQSVTVSAVINDLPFVNAVTDQNLPGGWATTAVNFTGKADSFTWTNDKPEIGLSATGTGNIPSFTAVNNTGAAIVATIAVRAVNSTSGCVGEPVVFSITVKPASNPGIFTGVVTSATRTVYGTPGPSFSFNVAGYKLTSGIAVKPPMGFEVSTDNVTFSPSVSLAAAFNGLVYMRLTQTAPAGSNYAGSIILSSADVSNVVIHIPASTVDKAVLKLIAQNASKKYGETLTDHTTSTEYSVSGTQNGETIGSAYLSYGVAGYAASPVSNYPQVVSVTAPAGGTFNLLNYTVISVKADVDIGKASLSITARNQTRVYGNSNPILIADYNGFVNKENVSALTSAPVLTTTAVQSSPVGQYPINVTGGDSPNYNITRVDGVLTITAVPVKLVVPTAFTPNGDGVNDVWDIPALASYPNCVVNIFTRSGERVFTSVGYGTPWDGNYNGSKLPVGTYYFTIDLKNGAPVTSGSVTIIR